MKFNIKLLAAAASLVLSSVGAHAAIDTSTNPSLLFIAFDGTGTVLNSYARIIGSVNDLGTTNLTFNAPAGSIFNTQFTGVASNKIYWDVVALDNVTPTVYGTLDYAALNGTLSAFDTLSIASILTNSGGGYTQLDNAANGYAKANGEYTGATNAADQTNASTMSTNFGFGTNLSGYGVGTSLNFIKVDQDGNLSQVDVNSALTKFNGASAGGYFTLLANGNLTWTGSAAAATPLPAAALLFAPGLLALAGARRRKNAA